MSSDKLRVVANISDGFLFSEVGAMPQRYKAAADAGFNAVSAFSSRRTKQPINSHYSMR